jgi:hypothetical protein
MLVEYVQVNRHMGVFHHNQINDVLFLMPVRLAQEKLPKSKTRMLYCDIVGKVYTTLISKLDYELARDSAERMARNHKPFATLGLEINPGEFIPATVAADAKSVWALEHILAHALKNGRLPDILKRYLRPIIQLDETKREAVISEYKKRRQVYLGSTPRVLNRLQYYPEHDIEFSMPIYKAEYSYPLIVMKHLLSDEHTPHSAEKLLILDSDGDLAVIKSPANIMAKVKKEAKKHSKKNGINECVIIAKYPKGLVIDSMAISQLQRKALDTMTRYFEETGYGKQPISAAAKKVIAKAKGTVSSPAK